MDPLLKKKWIRLSVSWSIFILLVSLPVSYAYIRSVKSGIRAEAQLMMSYIRTLENAYFLENGHYLPFKPYGASLLGQENCQQPEGAKRLGFLISWCAGAKKVDPVRYVYRVEVSDEDGYIITATSGSDRDGLSFVCLQNSHVDLWQQVKNDKKKHVLDCEPEPTKD